MIFTPEMEIQLARHIKDMAIQFHGLTKERCRSLAYEYAVQNGLEVPNSWTNDECSGRDCLVAFRYIYEAPPSVLV